jgi:hypothetical protein
LGRRIIIILNRIAEKLKRRSKDDSRAGSVNQTWKIIYPLPEILPIVLCGTMAGAEDFCELQAIGPGSYASNIGSPLAHLRTTM